MASSVCPAAKDAAGEGPVNGHGLAGFEHYAGGGADALVDIAARDTDFVIASSRGIGITIGPGPVLAGGQSYHPTRRERNGIAQAESLLTNDTGPIDASRRAGLSV